jgi:hypothetical protein
MCPRLRSAGGGRVGELSVGRHDTGHDRIDAVQPDVTTDDLRIGAEWTTPELVAQDDAAGLWTFLDRPNVASAAFPGEV